mmetsp:Transcript_29890/g.94213  ORF Transcript_29890/g.94213 Transcript_29890/m.94213 type:complete len:286 (+) Transcript_29890:266-1123(+)
MPTNPGVPPTLSNTVKLPLTVAAEDRLLLAKEGRRAPVDGPDAWEAVKVPADVPHGNHARRLLGSAVGPMPGGRSAVLTIWSRRRLPAAQAPRGEAGFAVPRETPGPAPPEAPPAPDTAEGRSASPAAPLQAMEALAGPTASLEPSARAAGCAGPVIAAVDQAEAGEEEEEEDHALERREAFSEGRPGTPKDASLCLRGERHQAKHNTDGLAMSWLPVARLAAPDRHAVTTSQVQAFSADGASHTCSSTLTLRRRRLPAKHGGSSSFLTLDNEAQNMPSPWPRAV